jgi:nitrate reductase NapA
MKNKINLPEFKPENLLEKIQTTSLDRKNFLKKLGTAYAVALAGPLAFTTCKDNKEETLLEKLSIKWDKAPCRFCGAGCGVMVGVKDNKIVAIAGDQKNPVNRGLLCIKGYHLTEILYGKDRITKPLIRKNGKLKESTLEEALDLVASKFKETIDSNGPDSIGIYGSGQWTIQDGYSASKLLKGGIGTNNLEANARLCMASAVTGFMTTFGKDEPMGCYDDFEHGEVFVLWGNNMAETHPVLFSRITENKRKNPKVKIVDITVRHTRTTHESDLVLEFNPQSDLAIANAIAREIIKSGKTNPGFMSRHVAFKSGTTQIGYGLENAIDPKIESAISSFEKFKESVEIYTLEHASKISGVPADSIKKLADYYADPSIKVVSLWCMGMNQHTRGTWINNLVYNIHLLTGKISMPGNGPFSLTGQPSACGTVREVGTLTHALPGGRNVTNPEDREYTEKIWGVKKGTIPERPSAHTIAMFRKLKDGKLKAIMIQTTNPMVTLPDRNKFLQGIKKHKPFIVVCDGYPTPTTEIADVVLPAAMWVEREGCFGNSERRTQQWDKLVPAPGDGKPDSWYTIEIGRRLGFGSLFPWKTEDEQGRGLYEEYRKFTLGVGKDIASYETLRKERGMRWPVVNGKETQWRYREGTDPYVKAGQGFSFYGNKKIGNRAVIWERPYEPPPEVPDQDYPFWLCTGRVLEHWHTGSMTRRVEQLHKAIPKAYAEINEDDAKALKIKDGEMIKLVTRRGEIKIQARINGRARPNKGLVFVPFFDENLIINNLTLDAHCPISKQTDYKKCAVSIKKG